MNKKLIAQKNNILYTEKTLAEPIKNNWLVPILTIMLFSGVFDAPVYGKKTHTVYVPQLPKAQFFNPGAHFEVSDGSVALRLDAQQTKKAGLNAAQQQEFELTLIKEIKDGRILELEEVDTFFMLEQGTFNKIIEQVLYTGSAATLLDKDLAIRFFFDNIDQYLDPVLKDHYPKLAENSQHILSNGKTFELTLKELLKDHPEQLDLRTRTVLEKMETLYVKAAEMNEKDNNAILMLFGGFVAAILLLHNRFSRFFRELEQDASQ